jgi:hypothetical protein
VTDKTKRKMMELATAKQNFYDKNDSSNDQLIDRISSDNPFGVSKVNSFIFKENKDKELSNRNLIIKHHRKTNSMPIVTN